jgi:hypothetical protein
MSQESFDSQNGIQTGFEALRNRVIPLIAIESGSQLRQIEENELSQCYVLQRLIVGVADS